MTKALRKTAPISPPKPTDDRGSRQVVRARRRSYASRVKVDDPTADPVFLEDIRQLAVRGEMLMIDNLILSSQGIVATEPVDLPTWAFENLWVPPGMGTRQGPMRLTAMQRSTARLVQNGVKRITYLKGPRIGFSFLIAAIMAYFAVHENDAVMMYDKSKEAAQTFSEDKFMKIFEASRKVAHYLPNEKASSDRQRWNNRTMINGAPVKFRSYSTGIKSDAARVVFMDEAGDPAMRDKNEEGEGSKVSLAEARCAEYGNSCLIIGGTPTNDGECTVSEEYALSNRSTWVMRFPCCGKLADWKPDVMEVPKAQFHLPHGPGLRYTTDEKRRPDAVWYECPHCSAKVPERYKVPMLETGDWIPQDHEKEDHWGIYSWMAHSQDPRRDWPNIAGAHREAKDFPDKMKAFVNMYLAQAYTPPNLVATHPHELKDRAIPFTDGFIPSWVEFLFAGIDAQEGEGMRPEEKPERHEIVVYGVGANQRRCVIAHYVVAWHERVDEVTGLLTKVNFKTFSHAAAEQIYAILDKDWVREDGILLRVIRTCCDVNWNTQAGMAFCNEFASRSRKIIPIVGGNEMQGALPPIPPNPEKGFIHEKTGQRIYRLGTQVAKSYLATCIQAPPEAPQSFSFPDHLDLPFYKSLLAEHLVETKSGRKVWRSKDKKKETGEVWDCIVYAYCAELMEREWTRYGRDVIKPTIRMQVEAVEAALDAAIEAKRMEKVDKARLEAIAAATGDEVETISPEDQEAFFGSTPFEEVAKPADVASPADIEAPTEAEPEPDPTFTEDVSLSSARLDETLDPEEPVTEQEKESYFQILRREEAERSKRIEGQSDDDGSFFLVLGRD